jgi:hypothetical protein
MKPERSELLFQGWVAGLLGYATVALFFAVENLIVGRSPFYTAGLLGQAYFYGLRDLSQLAIAPGPVLAFNGLHLIVFLVLGMLVAALAFLSEQGHQLWYVSAVFFLFIALHMLGFLVVLTEGVRAAVAPWTLVVAGVLACVAMGAYLLASRPELRRSLHAADIE